MYIGEKKLKGTLDQEDGTIKISFKDNVPDIIMNKNLFEEIKSDEKRKGDVTDCVRNVIATRFLMELSKYGLDFYMIEHVTQGMITLAHNLREETFGKAFGCKGLGDIKIGKLLDEYEEEV